MHAIKFADPRETEASALTRMLKAPPLRPLVSSQHSFQVKNARLGPTWLDASWRQPIGQRGLPISESYRDGCSEQWAMHQSVLEPSGRFRWRRFDPSSS